MKRYELNSIIDIIKSFTNSEPIYKFTSKSYIDPFRYVEKDNENEKDRINQFNDDDIKSQNKLIDEVCKEFSLFLQTKNSSYHGSVFNSILSTGLSLEEKLMIRIEDKIKRILNKKYYKENNKLEDDWKDLTGYLILKEVLKQYKEDSNG